MNNSAAKVGEIFTEAGAAFNKLADMVMMLYPLSESVTGSQVKTAVKKKLIDEKPVISTSSAQQTQPSTPNPQQITLNMLSSSEGEVKIEPSKPEIKTELQEVKEEEKTSRNSIKE